MAKRTPAQPKTDAAATDRLVDILACHRDDVPAFLAAYQRAAGLEVTGELDPGTWKALHA